MPKSCFNELNLLLISSLFIQYMWSNTAPHASVLCNKGRVIQCLLEFAQSFQHVFIIQRISLPADNACGIFVVP